MHSPCLALGGQEAQGDMYAAHHVSEAKRHCSHALRQAFSLQGLAARHLVADRASVSCDPWGLLAPCLRRAAPTQVLAQTSLAAGPQRD